MNIVETLRMLKITREQQYNHHMSPLAKRAHDALSAWICWRSAETVDEIRNARMTFDSAENRLGEAFDEANMRCATFEFGDWLVTIEGNEAIVDGGTVQTWPVIMYRKREGKR